MYRLRLWETVLIIASNYNKLNIIMLLIINANYKKHNIISFVLLIKK